MEEAPPSVLGDMVLEAVHPESKLDPNVDTVPEAPPMCGFSVDQLQLIFYLRRYYANQLLR
jgi:hypothetical protein